MALQTDKGIVLASTLIEHLRQQSVILPALNAVERASAEAITRANRRIYDALAEPLSDAHRRRLDDLLKRRDNGKTTWLAWLRQSPVKPNSRHMLEHIERLKAWQALDLGLEFKVLEDVAHLGREALDVAEQVLRGVRGIAQQLLQVQRRLVEERQAGLALEKGCRVDAQLLLGGQLGEHSIFGRVQHAIETAQHGEREDDLAVVGLLVIAAKEVGDGPDEGGQGGLGGHVTECIGEARAHCRRVVAWPGRPALWSQDSSFHSQGSTPLERFLPALLLHDRKR